jgi:uncharacterized protein (DUF58 family)
MNAAAAARARDPHDDATTPLSEILRDVRRIEAQAKRLVAGALSGGYGSVFRGAGVEFDEVREYAEGDDPRTIDWNVTARTGRPHIKKFVDERERSACFLVDLSPSLDAGFSARSPRRTAALIVACLALAANRNDDKVGFVGFGRKIVRVSPPRRGVGHALSAVRDVLALRADGGAVDFEAPLEIAARRLSRRSVVFLVSDFLSPLQTDALARCARRHDVTAVRLLPPELSPPKSGRVRLSDPESGAIRVVDFGDRRFREAYAARVDAHLRASAEAIRRARAEIVDVPVGRALVRDAVVRPLLRYFRMRELRSEKR